MDPREPSVPSAVRREDADAWVSTREQLESALAAGRRIIWVENDAAIDLATVADHRDEAPEHVLLIPEGVTLASGRSEAQWGGLLDFSRRLDEQRYMLALGPRACDRAQATRALA